MPAVWNGKNCFGKSVAEIDLVRMTIKYPINNDAHQMVRNCWLPVAAGDRHQFILTDLINNGADHRVVYEDCLLHPDRVDVTVGLDQHNCREEFVRLSNKPAQVWDVGCDHRSGRSLKIF